MSEATSEVGWLELGQCFIWCGRPVRLDEIEVCPNWRRPARWLTVSEPDGSTHRLHYYIQEVVEVVNASTTANRLDVDAFLPSMEHHRRMMMFDGDFSTSPAVAAELDRTGE